MNRPAVSLQKSIWQLARLLPGSLFCARAKQEARGIQGGENLALVTLPVVVADLGPANFEDLALLPPEGA